VNWRYLESSEVNHAVNVGVSLEDGVEGLLVGDIKLDELGLLAADSLNTVQGLGRGVVEVVSDDDLVTSLKEGKDGERANVARTTAGGSAIVYHVYAGVYIVYTLYIQQRVRLTQRQELNQQT
jgi:predicted DNA repair protein MutK